MKEIYSINEISDLYNIPKSKLRFWEEKGLIHPSRNQANGYRMYDMTELIDIGDIAFYRNLNVPIKTLKTYRKMNYSELKTMVNSTELEVHRKIEELKAIKKALGERKEKLEMVETLQAATYEAGSPDMEKLISYVYDDGQMIPSFQNDPYRFAVHIDVGAELVVTEALVVPKQLETTSIVWEKPATPKEYRMALLKMEASNPLGTADVSQHIQQLQKLGYQTKRIIGRYLSTFNDGERYDYFRAWFEVVPLEK